ncbi:MAG: tetratricopeptide repeat protein, partial [Thermodesulfobacteriota bacterium]
CRGRQRHRIVEARRCPGSGERLEGLLEWGRKRTAKEPENALAWYELRAAYDGLNRYDDAIEAYRQAIRIEPKDVDAWYNLGVAYSSSGNRTAALNAVQELRCLDSTSADKLFNWIVPR